jgi:hypothetical protein
LTNDREGKPEYKFDDDIWEQFLEGISKLKEHTETLY